MQPRLGSKIDADLDTVCGASVFIVRLPEKPDSSVYTEGATRSGQAPSSYLRLGTVLNVGGQVSCEEIGIGDYSV